MSVTAPAAGAEREQKKAEQHRQTKNAPKACLRKFKLIQRADGNQSEPRKPRERSAQGAEGQNTASGAYGAMVVTDLAYGIKRNTVAVGSASPAVTP